jgi:hypothetical protein
MIKTAAGTDEWPTSIKIPIIHHATKEAEAIAAGLHIRPPLGSTCGN